MADSFTPNRGFILQQTGNNVSTWGALLNNDCISILDNNLGGNLTKSVAGSSDVNLSETEAENLFYNFTGVLTGNISVIWPAGAGLCIVNNATSGAFTLTIKPTGGTGIVIPQGGIAETFISTNTGTAFLTNNIFIQADSPTFTGTVTVNGNETVNGAFSVVQAGSTQGYFGSTGSNTSRVVIDNAAGSQETSILFTDAGTAKWLLAKEAANDFVLFDNVGSAVFLRATTSGNLVLGSSQTTSISNSGLVGIGAPPSTYQLKVVQTGSTQAYIGSTGANDAHLVIDNSAGGHKSALDFSNAGAAKWSAYLDGNVGNWFLNDNVNSKLFITAIAGGSLILGPAQGLTINQGGGVFIAAPSSGNNTLSLTAVAASNAIDAVFTGNVSAGASFRDTTAGASSQTQIFFSRNSSVVGTISCTNVATAYNTSSDARLKNSIAALDASAIIDALNPVKFKWNVDDSEGCGLIAQEAYEVFPSAVQKPENPDDYLSVDYSKFVPLLLAEVKYLRQRVALLEAKNV